MHIVKFMNQMMTIIITSILLMSPVNLLAMGQSRDKITHDDIEMMVINENDHDSDEDDDDNWCITNESSRKEKYNVKRFCEGAKLFILSPLLISKRLLSNQTNLFK